MKNYRIVPGLEIKQNNQQIILENSFTGFTLEYENIKVLQLLDDFHKIETKKEFYEKYKDSETIEILDELFDTGVFEKKNVFLMNFITDHLTHL